jgi:hypothetical protein
MRLMERGECVMHQASGAYSMCILQVRLRCPALQLAEHEATGRRSGHMDASRPSRRANIEVDVGYWPFVVAVSGEVDFSSGRLMWRRWHGNTRTVTEL